MKLSYLVLVAVMSWVGAAQAAVIGGMVTSGSGSFVELDPTSTFSVGNDVQQSPNLYAFDEDQNIILPGGLTPEIGSTLVAGTVVASHYVFFDPDGATSQEGWVDFDADILAVFTSQTSLASTDFLINNNVTYLNPTLRGLESSDSVFIGGLNEENRLYVDWRASTPGDYVRVLTARSQSGGDPRPPDGVVPVPASVWFLLSGIGLLGWRRRRTGGC